MMMHPFRVVADSAIDFDGDGHILGWELFIVWIIGLSLVIGAIIVIIKAIAKLAGIFKRLSHMLDDWVGTDGDKKAGHPSTPGVVARLVAAEEGREQLLKNQAEFKFTLADVQNEQAKAAVLFQRGSDKMSDLQDQIHVLNKKVQQELSINGGSSVKDTANKALGVSVNIQRQFEEERRERAERQEQYDRDIRRNRSEWARAFDAVRKMIHLPPEEQAAVWDQFAQTYIVDIEEDPKEEK